MATSQRAMPLEGRSEPLVSQEFADEPELPTHQTRSALFRHIAGAAAAMVGICLAGLFLMPMSGTSLLGLVTRNDGSKPLARRPFLAMSRQVIEMEEYVPAVDDIVCDKYPYYEIQEVMHKNLGGHGPDSGDEGVVYLLKSSQSDDYLEMHLNAEGEYSPAVPKYNGCASLQVLTGKDCKGKFGAVNLEAGTTAEFTFSFYDPKTKEPVEVENAAITWFDIDENKAHMNTEQVGMKGFKEYRLYNPSNVTKEEQDDGLVLWKSSSYGDGSNNPAGPEGLTTGQKSLAVSVFYHKSKTMHASIAAGAGGVDEETGEEIKGMPRFFTFILMPSIPCARTLLPALHWKGPKESPIKATGEFYKWKKEVGDQVQAGDVIALVRDSHGSIKEIAADKPGFITQRQPFKMGDVMEQRMEAQPIAVVSAGEASPEFHGTQLPALPVGNGQVGVEAEGIFVEWLVDVGDKVQEGSVLARVNLTDSGPTVDVKAPYGGTVTDKQPFKPGEVMEDRMVKQPIATLTSVGRLPLASGDEAAKAPGFPESGLEFVEYKVEVGDPVKEGDVVATVKDGETGEVSEIKAPKDGFVKSLQMLTPGAPIDDVTADGHLAVIQDEKKLAPLNQNRPFDAIEPDSKEGVKFKKFLADKDEEVSVGDPIAVITHPDGTDEVLFAPEAGTVKGLQDLKEGDPLDEVLEDDDFALATVVPHNGDIGDLPVYTTLRPDNFPEGTKFGKWLVKEGDEVKQGDKVAEVTLPDGSKEYLPAPETGRVASLNADLAGGDDLKGDGSDDLTIVTPSDKATETCVEAPDLFGDSVLVAWHVEIGDQVRAGDKIATIKKPDGSEDIIINSKSGTVAEMGKAKPGEQLSRAADGCVVKVVSSPGEPGATYYPTDTSTLPAETILKTFMVEEGDKVKEGDAIAQVQLPHGEIVTLTASHDGWVDELIGNPGDRLDDLPESGSSVASIVDKPTDVGVTMNGGGEEVPSGTTTVSASPGDLLVEWRKRVGEPVKKGDVIAVLQRGGERVEVESPRDGTVESRAPIDDGDAITSRTASPLAIIEDPKLAGITEVQGATVEPGDKLLSWHADVADFVKEGEVVAVVERAGIATPVRAGTTGKVVFEQPLAPGDLVRRGQHDPLFQIDPFLPPFEETGASTQDGNKLVKWNHREGDEVKKGDVVAVVEQDGEEIPVPAPQDGTISFRQDLDGGDEIPEEKASPLFLVKNPNPLPDKVRGVSAAPDDKLVAWKKAKGAEVKEGDVVAVVERDGKEVELKAPHDGVVTFEQGLHAGDTIAEPGHSPMFKVERPGPLGSTAEGQNVEPGDKLLEWKHKSPDPVKEGDVVAVIERDGKKVPMQAPKDGFVSYTAPVDEGQEVNDENSKPLFSIDDGPYRPLPHGTGQSAEPGDILMRWHKNLDDVVRQGDLVATIHRDDAEVPVYAPRDGSITFQEDLDPRDVITNATANPIFVVTPPEPELPAGVAANAKPGDKFIKWLRNVPDEVPKGEPIALLERDGEPITLRAPNAGHVSFQQDWEPGQEIDSSKDSPGFLIDPRQYGPTDGTPVLAPDAEALGYQFIRFKSWAVAPGDVVEAGDAVAVVELVPNGMARRLEALSSPEGRRRLRALSPRERRLTLLSLLPKEMQVLSPRKGCVTETMDLHRDDRMDENYASRNMATIRRCPFHWSLWILLLLFVLSCCICCCVFICLKKRRGEKYNRMTKVGDAGAAGAGAKPMFAKPEEKKEAMTFDFRDHEGKIHSFNFTHRPLGIVYEKQSLPVQVQRLKFNSYAKWMGVQEGWTIVKVLKTDVSQKSVEEVEEVTYAYLRDKPIWPLRLDFKIPLAPGTPRHGEAYEKQPRSFHCTTQPIGLEFAHNKIPIVVSRVFPDTYASDQGIENKWKLVGIGHNSSNAALLDLESNPENLDYRDVMKNFRDAVSLLDVREDNHDILANRQKEKWEENVGHELTGHTNKTKEGTPTAAGAS